MKQYKTTFYHQLTSTDCGAACLAMIASFFGKNYRLQQLKTLFEFTRIGITIQDIVDNAIKQPPPKEVDLVKNEGIAFRAPIEMMCT